MGGCEARLVQNVLMAISTNIRVSSNVAFGGRIRESNVELNHLWIAFDLPTTKRLTLD